MPTGLRNLYESTVLGRPVATLVVVAAVTLSLGWFAPDFSLDASADSLILERDDDLRYYSSIRARYGSDDFLIVTYTPQNDLFDSGTLGDLRILRDELAALPNVASVTSILDVPLVNSPAVDLDDFSSGIRYLEDANTDRKLARQELLKSPLYQNLIISSDAKTTALRVNLRQDDVYRRLRARRDELLELRISNRLRPAEIDELSDLESRIDAYSQAQIQQQDRDIASIREIIGKHSGSASLHLGGVPMIIADSMDFIRHDLVVFGGAVLLFLIVILALAFRKRRWIFLPLLTCAATCLFMLGLLGLLDWRVTVVSSNFVSLLLILCLALTLHIIVRYRETHEQQPEADQFTLVSQTVRRIVKPCLYTALTTIVAFGSLLVSGIRPVIDFGWMISIGIVVAFVYSFTLFPAALMLLQPGQPRSRDDLTAAITRFFARLIRRYGNRTLLVFSLLALIGIAGTTRLTVENRFIDYYRKSTEIYQGMELIDRELGGTTPLEVIIDAPVIEASVNDAEYQEEFVDIYADETADEAGITSRSYWFNSWQLGKVAKIHDYLDGLPETGKVVSLASVSRILEQLDPDILQDNFGLSVIYKRLEPDIKAVLFAPYLSEDGNQLRFSVRVFESDPSLRRAILLRQIRSDLVGEFGLDDEQVNLTGMMVLYNNMLQSLFQSQVLTLGTVFLAIMAMFLVLFRSIRTAVTAIIPTLLSATLVLGLMGWFGIPLDLMTITIAAITVGIGVDDTIHYVHRFRYEFAVDGDYWAAIDRCHRSIGRAIYYTSVTIMLGFSILVLSNFIPTIYFGILTSLAMLVALLANMTLLPLLIVAFRTSGEPRSA
ncbi:MAG: MMPL family transporter [Proteobacteria bacterium]|nr:MMPL family transporter [Pseudomonadota bacterium]